MPRKTKYNNVLGKDFASQKDAYKHFQFLRKQFIENRMIGKPNGLFTEDTFITKSDMYRLLYDYGDQEYLDKKEIVKPYEDSIKNFWFARPGYKGYPGHALCYEKAMKHDMKSCEKCIDPQRICFVFHQEVNDLDRRCSAKKVFKCFPGKHETSDNDKISRAFRNVVKSQIQNVRDTKAPVCENCGASAERLGGHMDHKDESFKNLTTKFIDKNQYKHEHLISFIKEDDATADGFYVFFDNGLKEKWLQFHEQHASLQLLCTECHDQKTRKEISNG